MSLLPALKKIFQRYREPDFPSVSLFFGTESYLVQKTAKKVADIVSQLPPPVPVSKLEGRDVKLKDLLDSLQTLDMFGTREVVWLQEPSFLGTGPGVAKNQEWVLRALTQGLPKGRTLVLSFTGKLDARTKFYKDFSKMAALHEFEALSPYNLGDPARDAAWEFVTSELKQAGKGITPDGFRVLRERCPNDLWAVMTEVQKYVAASPEGAVIDTAFVEEMTPPTREEEIFTLLDALGTRDLGQALFYLNQLFMRGEKDIAILGAITNNFHSVLALHAAVKWLPPALLRERLTYFNFKPRFKEVQDALEPAPAEIKELLPLKHPFGFYQSLSNIRTLPAKKLYGALRELEAMDRSLKTSSLDGRRAIEGFITNFCLEKAG